MPFLRGTVKLESFLTFNGILWLSLVFGFYFKRNTSATICLLTKLYCIIFCVLNIVYILFNIQNPRSSETYYYAVNVYSVSIVTEISTNVLLSLITETESFIEFSSNLAANSLSTLQKKHFCFASYFMIFMSVTVVIVIFISANLLQFTTLEYIIYACQDLSTYFSRIPLIYVSDNYRKTVQSICKSLKRNLKNKQMNDAEKIKHVKDFIDAYIKLSKNLNSTITITRAKMMIAFGCDFLKLVSFVYFINTISIVELEQMSWCLEVIFAITLFCIPLCLMELSANDLDDIKYTLADHILMYKDKKLRDALNDALDYIDACSSKYTMWNQFPLNVNLVLAFLNLSASYVVALLQFAY